MSWDCQARWTVFALCVGATACGPQGAPGKYDEKVSGQFVAVSVIVVGDTELGSLPMLKALCGARDGVAIKGIDIDAWGSVLKAASGKGEFPVTLDKDQCAMVPVDMLKFDGPMKYEKLRKIGVSISVEVQGKPGQDSFVIAVND